MVEVEEEFCIHELVTAQCAFCKPGRTPAKAKKVRTKSVTVDHLTNGDGTVTSTRFTTCTECQIPIVPGDAVIVNGVGWAHEDCWL
jgi:hypothetical protein